MSDWEKKIKVRVGNITVKAGSQRYGKVPSGMLLCRRYSCKEKVKDASEYDKICKRSSFKVNIGNNKGMLFQETREKTTDFTKPCRRRVESKTL